jgi:hypothetical protein
MEHAAPPWIGARASRSGRALAGYPDLPAREVPEAVLHGGGSQKGILLELAATRIAELTSERIDVVQDGGLP